MGYQVPASEFNEAVPTLQMVSPAQTSGVTYSMGGSPSDAQYTSDKLVSPAPSVMPATLTTRPVQDYNDGQLVDWTPQLHMPDDAHDIGLSHRFASPPIPRSTLGTGWISRQIFVNGDVSSQFIMQSPRVPTGGGRLAAVFGLGSATVNG